MKNALIIVDVQYDFLPGGALAVPDGDKIIDGIVALAERDVYDVIIASCDWHPSNHVSFVENGGIWPKHCVANTKGADIHPEIKGIANYTVFKGFNPEKEAYSAFDGWLEQSPEAHPDLNDWLRTNHVTNVDICGLALDYCVFATTVDARLKGYITSVYLDLTRPVDYLTGASAIESMSAHNIELKTYDYK